MGDLEQSLPVNAKEDTIKPKQTISLPSVNKVLIGNVNLLLSLFSINQS